MSSDGEHSSGRGSDSDRPSSDGEEPEGEKKHDMAHAIAEAKAEAVAAVNIATQNNGIDLKDEVK